MSTRLINVKELYGKDPNLKRGDVQILQEWLKKEPHLPNLTESHLAIFLFCCYYSIESAKTVIEKYFTFLTHCPDVFDLLDEETLRETRSQIFINVLPKKTPQGYAILMIKLLDTRYENFNFASAVKAVTMVTTAYVYQEGFDEGSLAVFDAKGISLGHVLKLNATLAKHALYYVQDAAPVRIKSVHVINMNSFAEKAFNMIKPFLHKDLQNLIKFHSSLESLYRSVSKECLPEEYGGVLPPCQTIQDDTTEKLLRNMDALRYHYNLKVDESKRVGSPKDLTSIFGLDGTFKKLEID